MRRALQGFDGHQHFFLLDFDARVRVRLDRCLHDPTDRYGLTVRAPARVLLMLEINNSG
jgi:hypothetical protein